MLSRKKKLGVSGLTDLLAPENRERTALILSGIGSGLKGNGNVGNTLHSLMMMDMMKDKKERESRLDKEARDIIGSLYGRTGTPFNPAARQPSLVQSLGLEMGRSTPPQQNTANIGGTEYNLGRVDPWAGKRDIQQGIFNGESGGDYDALFGFSNRSGPFSNVRLTDMTVDEALQFADPNGPYGQWVKGQVGRVATPMGAYQVVGTTLGAAKKAMGLTGAERMTKELQDQIGAWVLENQGTGAWEGYQGPQSGRVRTAQNGQLSRADVLRVTQHEGIPEHTKQFILEEWRNQQKAGRGDLEVRKLADGYNYYVDPTGQREPVRVAPDIKLPDAKESEAEKKIARLKQVYPELTDQQAVGIAYGTLRVSRDPYTDEIQIVDLVTKQVYSPSVSNQQEYATGAETDHPPQEDQPPSFGTPFEDAENSFGLEGMVRRGLNSVSDFFTGEHVFPETAQTQQDFSVLREDLTNDMQAAYGQRLPSWALQALRDLTPKAGGFIGPDEAQNKLVSIGRKFQSELATVKRGLNRRGSPEMRAELEARISGLNRALDRVQAALGGFEPSQKNTTQSGVTWEVVTDPEIDAIADKWAQ